MPETLKLKGTRGAREATFRRESVDVEARTVELAFSSETTVDRWWGGEILDHGARAVRLDRINDGAPLLMQHQPSDQVGVVERAWIDKDRVGRCLVRFSRGARGEEMLQDVADGIRTKVSVGYEIHDVVLERDGDDGRVYRITDWEPLEVSLVSIPADHSVGVGRDHPNPEEHVMFDDDDNGTPAADGSNPAPAKPTNNPAPAPASRAADAPSNPPPAPAADPQPQESRGQQAPENPDAEQIRAVGRHFRMVDQAEDHIMLGGSLQAFRDMVRQQRPEPIPTTPRVESRIPHAGNLHAYRAEFFGGNRRDAEEHAYRAGQFCRAVIFGDDNAQRWCRDHGVAMQRGSFGQRVMTGLGAGQSVIVPDELALPIISLREQYGIARRYCDVHPMASDTASVPRDIGDAAAYFVGREQAPDQSDPDFDNINLTARNVAAETRLSNDYADDSVINLADHVAQKHARAFAVKEDECLFNGTGASTYGGIVGIRVALLSKAGAVDAASGHDTFAEITAQDLRAVMAVLPDYPGIDPMWFTSKPGQNLMFGRLTDAAGGNTKRDLSAAMPEQWAGYGIVTSPAMPKSAGDLSDVVMTIFGDLRMGVKFGDRRGMTMMVDPYSLSSYQQTKIISSERFDIVVHGVGDASDAGPICGLVGE